MCVSRWFARTSRCRRVAAPMLLVGAIAFVALAAAPPRSTVSPPDLTKGEAPTAIAPWNLGPTGASGWIFARDFDSSDARQILVKHIEKGSPAAGVLEVGDIIVGVNGRVFSSDARVAFAAAIERAEKPNIAGIASGLDVLCVRDGKRMKVTVPLSSMASYSASAPYDCAKSSAIVAAGCRAIAARGFPGGSIDEPVRGGNWDPDLLNSVNALALLSSGDAQYLDIVRDYAHRVGPANLDLVMREGLYAWTWGYANLFLTEYFLATKDEAVLPAIREYSHKIASGQSDVGTWGHGFKVDGNNGTLGGYGAINQCGLVCWISLILAEKCEVHDPVVTSAIAKSRAFFGFYIGKGAIPYGDHPPYWLHDDNGKCSAAAVAFDLLGDDAGARFFSRMATAAYGEKELGHTGNFLGYLWGALGANRAGPDAVAAFMKEQRWYYDLAREFNGGFFTNKRDNYDWPMTGVFVLHHALPLQKLMITGRETHERIFLRGAELRDTIASGREFNMGAADAYYATMTTAQLIRSLSDWSPSVRTRAARMLGTRPDEADTVVPKLVRMLSSKDLSARYGACLGLEHLEGRSAAATPELIKQLDEVDMWLRIRAAFALTAIGQPALAAVPILLRRSMLEDPQDPRGMEAKYLTFALFRADYIDQIPRQDGLISHSLVGVDRELVYPVVRRMLASDDGLATMAMRSIFQTLSLDELNSLLPSIVNVANRTAPSGEMFAQEIRVEALRFMANHQIREGLPVFIEYARTQNGWGSKTKEILPLLLKYGAEARAILPELRALESLWLKQDAARDEQQSANSTEKSKTQVIAEVIAEVIAAIDAAPRRADEPKP